MKNETHEKPKETSGLRLLCKANAAEGEVLVVEREAACGMRRFLFIHVRR